MSSGAPTCVHQAAWDLVQAKYLYDSIDTDHSGTITYTQFESYVKKHETGRHLTDEQRHAIFELLDLNHSGGIERKDFEQCRKDFGGEWTVGNFNEIIWKLNSETKRREELKSRVLYECWAFKRGEGGLLHSSAYRKRYFIITDQQRLNYYENPEDYYLSREPKGTLSCVGMLVKDGNGTETIGIAEKTDEGKVYFTFTLQAREGSRTSDIQCACETNVEREKLIATIQDIEQVARSRKESPAPKSLGGSPTALARPLNCREELKSRVLYECWAIKRGEGGLLHSSAYRKRYFIITDQQRLNYYENPEDYYLSREPKGTLSCVGMLVKDGNGTETIGIAEKTDEGKVYFTFTLQAREGSRTSDIQCACETNVEREKLIATIQDIEQVARSREESPAPKSLGGTPTALARPLNGCLPTSPTALSRKESPTPNGRVTSPTAMARPNGCFSVRSHPLAFSPSHQSPSQSPCLSLSLCLCRNPSASLAFCLFLLRFLPSHPLAFCS